MLSKSALSAFYERRAKTVDRVLTPPLLDAISRLDPFVCRALLLGHDPASVMGEDASWSTILDSLGLGGMRVKGAEASSKTLITSTLEMLRSEFPEEAGLVDLLTSRFVFLEADKGGITFASAAFRELPHCTLLTAFATRHVAPSTVFPRSACYPLMENLVHEAVHQQLYVLIDMGSIFRPGTRAAAVPSVYVPWRNTHWDLFKVLHTALVYAACAKMRSVALNRSACPAERASLAHGLAAAELATSTLFPALEKGADLFTAAARSLIAEAQDKVRAIFGTAC